MSTSPEDTGRKVRQLDHDVQAAYEVLARLEATQQRHGNRLEEIATAQVKLTTSRTRLAIAQAQLTTAQAQLAATQEGQGGKLDRILGLVKG